MSKGARSDGGSNGGGGGHPFARPSIFRSPYAVLNLPRQWGHDGTPVGDDTIRDSYRRLSRLLHPDKQPPGREREDAQEVFLELQHAYEILADPALRQAYDHFGHLAVVLVRSDRHAPDSLYSDLIALHDDGRADEALELLHTVLEDSMQTGRVKEWSYDADVEISVHACGPDERPEVTSTNVSLSASVPMPRQTAAASPYPAPDDDKRRRQQKMQLSIGGRSSIENGMGSTRAVLSANYQPVAQTNVTSDLTVGHRHLETSLSSSTRLANQTNLSAKLARRYKPGSGIPGALSFGFSSSRTLALFSGRTVHATFALGMGVDYRVHYGLINMTTWGFSAANERDADQRIVKPQISAKLSMGTQYPVECTVVQSDLLGSPHRTGRATVAWSPFRGFKFEGGLSRKLARRCASRHHESEFRSQLDFELEHAGLGGLTWILGYKRPDGLSVRIPVFVSSILSPAYWHRAVWVSAISFLIDESVGDWMSHVSSKEPAGGSADAPPNVHGKISGKIRSNRRELQWTNSSPARQNAERQLSTMAPIAKVKRQREESMDGLVILKATYASVPPPSSNVSSSRKSLDVTQQLQFWVENSRLRLPPSSKSVLLGFCDLLERSEENKGEVGGTNDSSLSEFTHGWICFMNVWLSRLGIGGEDSRDRSPRHEKGQRTNAIDSDTEVILTVRYKYKGQVFELNVDDNDKLDLPSGEATSLGASDVVS